MPQEMSAGRRRIHDADAPNRASDNARHRASVIERSKGNYGPHKDTSVIHRRAYPFEVIVQSVSGVLRQTSSATSQSRTVIFVDINDPPPNRRRPMIQTNPRTGIPEPVPESIRPQDLSCGLGSDVTPCQITPRPPLVHGSAWDQLVPGPSKVEPSLPTPSCPSFPV